MSFGRVSPRRASRRSAAWSPGWPGRSAAAPSWACCWAPACSTPGHDRAHYFFARARWELDQLGLAVAQLAVLLMLPPGADLEVAVDDSVFRRAGRKVHGAGWQHDGSAPSTN